MKYDDVNYVSPNDKILHYLYIVYRRDVTLYIYTYLCIFVSIYIYICLQKCYNNNIMVMVMMRILLEHFGIEYNLNTIRISRTYIVFRDSSYKKSLSDGWCVYIIKFTYVVNHLTILTYIVYTPTHIPI